MKAAILVSRRTIRIEERPKPAISSEREVLLRVETVGLCGSDLHYFGEERVGDTVMDYPVILGHECAGVVEETGGRVEKVKEGDRVAVEPAVSCGACDQCTSGRRNTCREISFLGHKDERSGALAEFLVMPEECCYPIPDDMTFVEATLAEPFSIGLHAKNLAGSITGRTVAVLGSGPIGMSVGLAVLQAGAASLYMTDKIDARLKAAVEHVGAEWTGNPLRSDIVADIMARIPEGLDLVFECCGQQEALDQAVEILKPGGSLLMVGIPVESRVSFRISRLRRKEIRLQNVRRQNHCVGPALDLIDKGSVNVDFLATHTFPLEAAQQAFDTAANYEDGVIKALVQP